MISGARTGLAVLADGMRMLRRERSLWLLAAAPALLATVSVCLAVFGIWTYADSANVLIAGWLPTVEASSWYSWLWVGPARVILFAAHWVLFLLAAALTLILAFLVANVAAAPFLDRLSQRVEALVLGRPVAASGRSLWTEVRYTVANELRRIVFFAGIWGVIALVGLTIPGAQLIAPIAFASVTILFLPLEYGGCALDRRFVAFRTRRQWVRRNLSLMTGFGGGAFLTFLVPGLNFVMIPTLVVAGTLLVLRHPPTVEDSSERDVRNLGD